MNKHPQFLGRYRKIVALSLAACLAVFLPYLLWALELSPAVKHFKAAQASVAGLFEAGTNARPRTFVTKLKLVKAEGLPKEWLGQSFDLALQAPDRIRVQGQFKGIPVAVGRNGQEVWINAPAKNFCVNGQTNVALFASSPEYKKADLLAPLRLPLTPQQLTFLPLLMDCEKLKDERVGDANCHVVRLVPKAGARDVVPGLPEGVFQLWIRESDSLPIRWGYEKGELKVEIELESPVWESPWAESRWRLPATEADQVQPVAREHVVRLLEVLPATLNQKAVPLGLPTGARQVVAREGKGRLELRDDTQVLFLQGTPEEMGHQHGRLLRRNVRSVVDHILYGVGVGSSFAKGRWFFGEIEAAQARLLPFMDARYLREMDALAAAAGVHRDEMRLANFFPELFHCSGFALVGEATQDGHLYHGRILDYMKGVGLEPNAVVMVMQPDVGHAWVNVSYAGFVGSVTAMNNQRIAIGEMGGRGEGNWDGKPMAQLVREVMEKAATLDEAVRIMRESPRTCEYYYVISDGKTKQAVGIYATPEKFEVLHPGEAHPQVKTPVKDAVLFSGGDRLVELTKRVQAGWGKFEANSSRDLMTRPVCMKSNIHSVLFRPDTLDFWVANADGVNVASHARYTQYNLAELLHPEKP